MRSLTVDPGKKMCGYSLWVNGDLNDCGIVRTKNKDMLIGASEMAMDLPRCIDVMAVERMRIYRPRPGQNLSRLPNPQSLIDISIVSGVLMGFVTATSGRYYLPFATEWKGNLPKNFYNAIIGGLAPGATKLMDKNKVAQSYRHHVFDAVGIGLWVNTQERKATCR